MLPEWLVEEIERQLAAGATQRAVSRRLPVSRGTVALIALGKRPDYEAARQQRRAEREAARAQGRGPATRCPKCREKVYGPCRACRTRAELQAVGLEVQAARHRGERMQQLQLQLLPAEQARYDAVHAEKVRLTAEEAQPDWPEAEFEDVEGRGRKAGPVVEKIRFICPCGQLLRAVFIWRPGKPEVIRFQARCRAGNRAAWLDIAHCPRCHQDFSKVTPEHFRDEVLATSLPTGNRRINHGARSGEAAP